MNLCAGHPEERPVRRYPLVLFVGLAAATVAAVTVNAHAATAPAVTPEDRARAIVAQLTLDEKIAQLDGLHTSTQYRVIPALPRPGIPPRAPPNGPARGP